MCGIAGIFDLAGTSEIDKTLVRRMGDAIRHRGPDGDGYFLAPGDGLSHPRLSTSLPISSHLVHHAGPNRAISPGEESIGRYEAG